MTQKHIWLNLGGLIALIGLLGLFYWTSTGTRAVPALTESLKDKDSKVRIAAAQMLADIGPAAKSAVPNLLEQALHDPIEYAGTTASGALKSIDLAAARQVMSAYLPALNDDDVQARRKACAMLGSLGPVAKPAVPALIVALSDVDARIRMHAVGALGEIGIPATMVIPALTKALHDKAQPVRHRALSQFAFSIQPTESVLPHLKELTEDRDLSIAILAKSALNSPHRQAKDRASVYVTTLQMGRGANDYALHKLAQLGPEAAGAVPAVMPVLKDERPLHRYLAAEVLGAIGPRAKDAVPALTAALQDEDAVVRESVAEALRTIGAADASSKTMAPK
jgi:HEAT repeat protein